ncbi:MAG: DUF58 domain-containing protein [Actinomycetota bacterium]|nr:DUF58 domain-containing protein [Actinomycetota bacterium]
MFFSRSLFVLVLSLALIIIGINSQSGWLFWLAALLLSALGISWLLSLQQVRGLGIKRRHRPRVSEEEELEITLEVTSRGRFSRYLLEVIDTDPRDGDSQKKARLKAKRKSLREQLDMVRGIVKEEVAQQGERGKTPFLIPHLGAGGDASLTYRRGGLSRGIYEGWPALFYSEGILGLARHSSRVECSSRLVVYPWYAELSSFPLVDSFLHPQRLPHDHLTKGVGTDYYGVREFRPGDPLRHVHWKTTARKGELVVREFEREVGTPLTVLIDNHYGHLSDKDVSQALDSSARLAASIVHYAFYAGHPVRLISSRDREPVVFRVPTFQAALEWLAGLRPEEGPDREERFRGLYRELEGESFLCFILADTGRGYGGITAALPPMCQVALILVDVDSFNGNGTTAMARPAGEASGPGKQPFPGFHSVSFYGKGDDIRECLERPTITFNGSQPLGR